MNNEVSLVDKGVLIEKSVHTMDWLLRHMDLSASTIGDYSSRLGPFVEYLIDNGLNESTLIRYKQSLAADTTLSVSTKNKKLTIARLFLKALFQRGVISRDVVISVKGFRQSNKHKLNGLDDDDMKLIREWVGLNQSRSPKHLRLTCLLLLLTYHGLREIEVCRLQYTDIDFADNRVFIHGKGRDDKEAIHLNPDVAFMLKRYCRAFNIKSGYVFTSLSNNRSKGEPLSTRGLRQTIKDLFNKLGIDKTVHGLRHYYVTKLVQEFPGDLFTVMSFSRHKSLEQLQVYNDSVNKSLQYPKHDMVFNKVLI